MKAAMALGVGLIALALAAGCARAAEPANTNGTPVAPAAWRMVEGALYPNDSKNVPQLWERNMPGNIRKADTNWPGVLAPRATPRRIR
jgi:hypothetical protein